MGKMMTVIPALLLQSDVGEGVAVAAGGLGMLVALVIAAVFIIALWKVFTKAGQPGWAVLIPIFNVYTLLKVAGRPGWWIVLFFIPIVNIVIAAIVSMDIAKAFGQSAVFGLILLFLLSGIGYLILGFGNYRYTGAAPATA